MLESPGGASGSSILKPLLTLVIDDKHFQLTKNEDKQTNTIKNKYMDALNQPLSVFMLTQLQP